MIFSFYLVSELFLFPGFFVLRNLFKRELPLAAYKLFGLLLVSIVAWFLTSLFGTSTKVTFIFVFALLTALPFGILKYKKVSIKISKAQIKHYAALTLFSFFMYLLLNYARSFRPDIIGTEKFMDVALINTILKQDRLPIENPWFSGFYMNYYYLGQYMVAMLQMLSGTTSNIGYNLAISLWGIFVFQMFWIFLKRFVKSPFWTYVFALTATFGGNIELYYESISQHKDSVWFASATRVIPFTINEFSSYSIILGDLHGHYLSLPFFILALLLIYEIWNSLNRKDSLQTILKEGVAFGAMVGALFLVNSWDIFTFILVCFMFTIISFYIFRNKYPTVKKLLPVVKKYGFLILGIAVPALTVFLFSRLFFSPPVAGVGVNTAFSNPFFFLLLFGQFMFTALVIAISIFIFRIDIWKDKKYSYQFSFLIGLVGTAIILIIVVEFLYAKDVFSVLNPPYSRTNTVFKFYYHAWALFCVGLFAMLGILLSKIEAFHRKLWLKVIPSGLSLLISIVMLSYFSVGISQFLAPKFTNTSINRLYDDSYLDGYTYVSKQHENDLDIIQYLESKPYAHILEYIDYESYSYAARVSAYTGDSAVQGWPLHNVQWYGGYNGKGIKIDTKKQEQVNIAERVTDIATLYTSTDSSVVSALLKKYNVKYVVFGQKEKEFLIKSEKQNMYAPYDNICSVIWSKNDARIYQCQ